MAVSEAFPMLLRVLCHFVFIGAVFKPAKIFGAQEAVTLDELANDEEYADILQDMRQECEKVRCPRLFEVI